MWETQVTRINIDAPEHADWKRRVVDHIRAWATWDEKTPAPVTEWEEQKTAEIRYEPGGMR